MILDVNVLVYATHTSSPHHSRAAQWLTTALGGDQRIGIPWQTVGAFLRITTHPRIMERPLTANQAWAVMDNWLAEPVVWMPAATERTVRILRRTMLDHHLGAGLTTDAQLAALAIEHGVAVVSADTDFGRMPGLRWINPLDPSV